MTEVKIIMPSGAFGSTAGEPGLITAMRIIGVGFGEPNDWCAKYGTNFENDVFAMRRYYWGDCECGFDDRSEEWHEANPHAPECYQIELDERMRSAGVHWQQEWDGTYAEKSSVQDSVYDAMCLKHGKPKYGCAVHCTCYRAAASEKWNAENTHTETCGVILPNFHFKQTDFRLEWYKYIGRGMEVKRGTLPYDFMEKIFASHPTGMTLAQAITETERQEGETAASFAQMFSELGVQMAGAQE